MKKNKKPIPVAVILGPTGVGKTSLLIDNLSDIAEVISADAYQVYRGMDIGTAKPTPLERKKLPHHLIDILSPDRQYTVGDFVRLADKCAQEIAARKRLPVVAGGTAYYLKHFIYGLPQTPCASYEIRQKVKEYIDKNGLQKAWQRLNELDSKAAEKISKNDVYRISRALEVIEQTGKTLSSFELSGEKRSTYKFLLVGLTRPREVLYERINRRVDKMFADGLTDELASLVAGGFDKNSPGLKAIGYREFFLHESEPVDTIKNEIKKNTRRFAKRQMTFFKSFEDVQWFEPDDLRVVELIKDFAKAEL